MLKTERQPAFWRVVRVREGVREYWRCADGAGCDSGWTSDVRSSARYPVVPTFRHGGHVVPVYHSVRKVQRGHDFAWAFRQSKAGKEVRVLQDNGVWRNCKTLEALVLVEAILKLSNAWQLGAQL